MCVDYSSGRVVTGSADHTLRDEVTEHVIMENVKLLISEWVPFGANQIVALNETLGSADRCKGGMFTAQDLAPIRGALERKMDRIADALHRTGLITDTHADALTNGTRNMCVSPAAMGTLAPPPD